MNLFRRPASGMVYVNDPDVVFGKNINGVPAPPGGKAKIYTGLVQVIENG